MLSLHKPNINCCYATYPIGQFRVNFRDLQMLSFLSTLWNTTYNCYVQFFTLAHTAIFSSLFENWLLYHIHFSTWSTQQVTVTHLMHCFLFSNVLSYLLFWLHPIRTDDLYFFPYMVNHIWLFTFISYNCFQLSSFI